jgi:hypothetical protein
VFINILALYLPSKYKYLGVFLDDSLTWKSHVEYITTKVGKRLGLLRRTRKDLTANAANIYKTFILPILDYCDSVWACCNRSDIDQLEHLQNPTSSPGPLRKDAKGS